MRLYRHFQTIVHLDIQVRLNAQHLVCEPLNANLKSVLDEEVLLGKPTIKGTRMSVELVLKLLASGWTEKQILKSYPQLTEQNLKAVFAYLKDCIQPDLFFPFPKSAK